MVTHDLLRQGIAAGELVLYHQPKIALEPDGGTRVDSCESLVRWRRGDGCLISPNAFIPLAEKEGLMGPLTDAVFDMAMGQVKAWRGLGIATKLAVNVPPHLLSDTGFVRQFSSRLRRHEVVASDFIIEVTERTLIEDAAGAMETLTQLRGLGTGLSIDDFGTGHSSLTQLHQMPFNEIKIDKTFIDDVEKNDESRAIVNAIINLAHGLGMNVCAEGVETAETLQILKRMACDTIQGHYFDPPLDSDGATKLLRDGPDYSSRQ
jgi:EAL domain-containing protein (putative c-di-GMP-specific phosphodiesterase class I)